MENNILDDYLGSKKEPSNSWVSCFVVSLVFFLGFAFVVLLSLIPTEGF